MRALSLTRARATPTSKLRPQRGQQKIASAAYANAGVRVSVSVRVLSEYEIIVYNCKL